MALQPRSRVGPYEVVSVLGSGGMGEVYRARDTKLNRDVALKVLPDAFTRDADRLARFKREAQVLASLNHPNIASIYGFEDSTGVDALVLELVEGPTLADRIAKGPLPIAEALPIARQVAEALEAAHEQGIIHRDLKPANIKLRPDGTVKVLDFGLAKALEPTSGRSPDFSASPTITSPAMTRIGVILGTAAYMSPEQARGKLIDKRTDVWAFGCVLFELMTGRKAFDGETLTDTVAAIVKNDPDWTGLPPGTPAGVRSLLARCLRKDPAQRQRDIADARYQIEDGLSQPVNLTASVKPVRRAREWVGWIAAGLLLVATLLLAGPLLKPSPPADAISFPVFPPDGAAFSAAFNTTLSVPSFALAPDGRALVFSAETPGARPMLWVRSLDDVTAHQLAGTEDAQDPLWSPDSRWIAFSAAGKLKKVPVSGGAVQTIAQTAIDFRGGAWGPDGTILFAGGTEPILLVNATGGQPQPVTTMGVPIAGRNPHWLPDGRHFLYTLVAGVEQSGVYVGSLDGRTKKTLIQLNTSAVYASSGYLLYVDGNTLLGQAVDVDSLELKGQSFLIAEHVGRNSAYMSAVSASRTGSIAYAAPLSQTGHLTWIDRAGHSLGNVAAPEADYADFRLSPDETRLAASMVDRNTNTVEIWLTDLARNSTSRFAFGGAVTASALWSPDGSRLAFRANQKGLVELYQRSAAGGGSTQTMLSVETYRPTLQTANLVATDWSPDGKQILFSAPSAASGNDLWLFALGEEGRVIKFIDSPGEQMHGNFSPDGRLVAYTSNESGQFEVYIETVPRSDRKWAVSTNGGYEPRWRGDGREVYYLSQDRTLMSVAVGAGPSFGIPKPMFKPHVSTTVIANRTHYVPSRDGQRFLVNVATDVAPSPITVVINWTAALKK